jgi:hypothetical protein
MKDDKKPVKINATLMWASLQKENTMSGKFQVELTELSPAAVSALEELGVEANKNPQKPEKGFYVTCKSSYPIVAYDKNGNEIDCLVGNGSKAQVVLGSYQWQFKNKTGVSPSIKKLVVTDLVKYVAEDSFADLEEEAL